MSPPINIDGSEIQEATIDGQDVNEITIDGQQAALFGPPQFNDIITLNQDAGEISSGNTVNIGAGFNDREIIVANSSFDPAGSPPSLDGQQMTTITKQDGGGVAESTIYRLKDNGNLGSSVTYTFLEGRVTLHRFYTCTSFSVVDTAASGDLSGAPDSVQIYTNIAGNGSQVTSLSGWDNSNIISEDVNSNEFATHTYNEFGSNSTTNVPTNPSGGGQNPSTAAITIQL